MNSGARPSPLSRARPLWLVDLSLVGVAVAWGANNVVIKHALTSIDPLAFNAFRFGLGSLTLLLILWVVERDLRLQGRDLWLAIGVGVLGHTLYQYCFIIGLSLTTAGKTAVILAISPVCVACGERLAGRERYSWIAWAGAAASLLGVVLVTAGAVSPSGAAPLTASAQALLTTGERRGDLLILVATLCWAGYIAASRPLLARYSVLKVTTITMSIGAFPLILASWPSLMRQPWHNVTLASWAALAFSYAVPLVLGYLIWSWGIQRIGSTRTAIYLNLCPLVASVLGWLTLGESWTPLQMAGAALVLLGITQVRKGGIRA